MINTLFLENGLPKEFIIIRTFLVLEYKDTTKKHTHIYTVQNLLTDKILYKFSIYINVDIKYPFPEDSNSIIEFRMSKLGEDISNSFIFSRKYKLQEYLDNYSDIDNDLENLILSYIKL